jgi:hypothetical protein
VPVTTSVALPRAVDDDVWILRVELPAPVTELGLKLQVAPAGTPETEKLTVPLNPLSDETVTVYEVAPPAATFLELGLIESAKSGCALTTRVTEVVCTSDPLVPVIVSG